jgi:hypothetical protein
MNHRRLTAAAMTSTLALVTACGSSDEPQLFDTAADASTTTSAGASTAGGGADGAGGDDGGSSACGEIKGEGFALGDVAENWTLPNALGQMIALHNMCGKVIFYEEGSLW